MVGLLIKLIVLPLGILLSNYLFGLDYTVSQALLVSLILIVADQMLEWMILREGALWTSTVIDSVAAFLIVYLSQYYLTAVTISFWTALATTLLLGLAEYFQHAYLIRAGRVRRFED